LEYPGPRLKFFTPKQGQVIWRLLYKTFPLNLSNWVPFVHSPSFSIDPLLFRTSPNLSAPADILLTVCPPEIRAVVALSLPFSVVLQFSLQCLSNQTPPPVLWGSGRHSPCPEPPFFRTSFFSSFLFYPSFSVYLTPEVRLLLGFCMPSGFFIICCRISPVMIPPLLLSASPYSPWPPPSFLLSFRFLPAVISPPFLFPNFPCRQREDFRPPVRFSQLVPRVSSSLLKRGSAFKSI